MSIVCGICGKVVSNKQNLNRHQKNLLCRTIKENLELKKCNAQLVKDIEQLKLSNVGLGAVNEFCSDTLLEKATTKTDTTNNTTNNNHNTTNNNTTINLIPFEIDEKELVKVVREELTEITMRLGQVAMGQIVSEKFLKQGDKSMYGITDNSRHNGLFINKETEQLERDPKMKKLINKVADTFFDQIKETRSKPGYEYCDNEGKYTACHKGGNEILGIHNDSTKFRKTVSNRMPSTPM